MLEFDTTFHACVRKLKSPTSSAFDAAAWAAALSEGNTTDLDVGLVVAAMWLAAQSAALRQIPKEPEFEALDATASVTLAVATVNREFLTAEHLSEEAIKEAQHDGALAFGHMVLRPLRKGSTGQSLSADDAIEAAVDAAESWLFDAYAKADGAAKIADDLASAAFSAMRRYSIQRGLNDLWNQCYWEGWRLISEDNKLVWTPSDWELATRLEAALIRQSENFMNYPIIDMAAWIAMSPEQRQTRALPRTVTGVSIGRRRKIRVGRPACRSRRPPSFLIERGGLEGSYLDFLLDRTFPKENRFTCRLILQAWHVVLDLALTLAKSLQSLESFSLEDAQRLALLVTRKELLAVFMRAIDIDESAADAVITFLTFKPKAPGEKGHRGLWAAPIVPIPGEDRFALALPALAVSNTLRKTEAWLERGGIDDNLSKDARGDVYEVEYRRKVCEAIAKNKLLKNARCADHEIRKDANFSEQIDLLIRLGQLLIVGEVKCWLFPADPFERFNHLRKLRDAARQASRKAELLRKRPDVAAKALYLTEEECRQLRVVPLVVANQGFGFSLNVDGCLVTDATFLRNYLGAGAINTGMAIDPRTGQVMPSTTTFYERETQAGDRFESMFATPVVLKRFIDRISWTRIPFPTASGGRVYFAAPRLGDFVGEERTRAQIMTRMMSGS
jgi:hypothetical protein